MNLKQARMIRKEVYGDNSQKGERTYKTLGSGQIVSTGLRLEYKLNKRLFKKGY